MLSNAAAMVETIDRTRYTTRRNGAETSLHPSWLSPVGTACPTPPPSPADSAALPTPASDCTCLPSLRIRKLLSSRHADGGSPAPAAPYGAARPRAPLAIVEALLALAIVILGVGTASVGHPPRGNPIPDGRRHARRRSLPNSNPRRHLPSRAAAAGNRSSPSGALLAGVRV
jgi:hypothetical protein